MGRLYFYKKISSLFKGCITGLRISTKHYTCVKEILTITCMFPVLLLEEMEAQSASKYTEGDKISYYNTVYACLQAQT